MNVKEYVHVLLDKAILNEAADIFFIPIKSNIEIIFKLQNKRENYDNVDALFGNKIINYLKFQSNMDISEKRRPQIGSLKYDDINLRLSSVGNYQDQEILVIRLIYSKIKDSNISVNFNKNIKQKGLILFSGPMGSGKTSLMYKLAKDISHESTIMCIEDPIEIGVEGFLQLQVNENAGLSYEELIKSSLRQRPDVLIIGEIRDETTAKLAVKAAMSGYTVMSTIHARSKYAVINRMVEFGVDKYSLLSVLISSTYQRLIPGINGDLVCVVDSLEDFEKNENKRDELNDWQDILKDLVNRKVICQNTFEEYKYG